MILVLSDEERKIYKKEYRDRPENKAKEKEYKLRPEVKAKLKARQSTSEYKAKQKERKATPEHQAWLKKYNSKPEVKAMKRANKQKPEYKAKQKEYKLRPEYKAKQKEFRDSERLKVLQYYSKRLSKSDIPCCRCCGENFHIEFLAIDHIAGRKEMDSELKLVKLGYSSSIKNNSLAFWIIKNNFPKGFQILCHNCNFAKGKYANKNKCPHEK